MRARTYGFDLRHAEQDRYESFEFRAKGALGKVRAARGGGPEAPKQTHMSYRLGGPPVIVTIRDNKDYNRVLVYSYYSTITGWGVLLRYRLKS